MTFYLLFHPKNVNSSARTLSINHPKMGLLPYLNDRISGTTRQVDFQWDEPEHLQPWFEIISLWRCFCSNSLEWSLGMFNAYKLPKTLAPVLTLAEYNLWWDVTPYALLLPLYLFLCYIWSNPLWAFYFLLKLTNGQIFFTRSNFTDLRLGNSTNINFKVHLKW